jgi:hypothetical protein
MLLSAADIRRVNGGMNRYVESSALRNASRTDGSRRFCTLNRARRHVKGEPIREPGTTGD